MELQPLEEEDGEECTTKLIKKTKRYWKFINFNSEVIYIMLNRKHSPEDEEF